MTSDVQPTDDELEQTFKEKLRQALPCDCEWVIEDGYRVHQMDCLSMLNLKALQAEAYKKGQIAAYEDVKAYNAYGIDRGYSNEPFIVVPVSDVDEALARLNSGLEQHNGQ